MPRIRKHSPTENGQTPAKEPAKPNLGLYQASAPRNINLRAIDVGILAVFDAVMTFRNVTRAGRHLHMSQPAVSSAMKKLRYLLGDNLFVRIPEGIRPTPRALELALPIRHLLSQIQAVFEPETFLPETETRRFKLALSEHCAMLILPELTTTLLKLAPGIQLQILQKQNEKVGVQLASGDIDIAVGTFLGRPGQISEVTLFTDSYVCAMRKDHPLARRIKAKDYLAAKHLLVSPNGTPTQAIDEALSRRGLGRDIAMTVNQLSFAPPILKRTDLIMTTYNTLANHGDLFNGLHVQIVPFKFEPVHIRLQWHEIGGNHLASRWLRSQIAEICRQFQRSR